MRPRRPGSSFSRASMVVMLVAVSAMSLRPQPTRMTSSEVRAAADSSRLFRVVVSIRERRLLVLSAAGDTLRSAPVAVGSGKRLVAAGRTWLFSTPIGVRAVTSIEADPVWVRPDWAYVELARQLKLRLDSVTVHRPRPLAGGDSLVVRAGVIGTVSGAAFEVWPIGRDIAIGKTLYMPPPGSPYRRVPGSLGRFRLNLGGSIGFHGTLDTASIGRAVTHGCMRLHDADIEWLYGNVPVGTPVFIY